MFSIFSATSSVGTEGVGLKEQPRSCAFCPICSKFTLHFTLNVLFSWQTWLLGKKNLKQKRVHVWGAHKLAQVIPYPGLCRKGAAICCWPCWQSVPLVCVWVEMCPSMPHLLFVCRHRGANLSFRPLQWLVWHLFHVFPGQEWNFRCVFSGCAPHAYLTTSFCFQLWTWVQVPYDKLFIFIIEVLSFPFFCHLQETCYPILGALWGSKD